MYTHLQTEMMCTADAYVLHVRVYVLCAVFGEPQGTYWEEYGVYFGDDSWIHSQIVSVIANGTASGVNTKELAVSINGALIDALQLGAAIAFFEDARENLVLGLENPQLMNLDDVKSWGLKGPAGRHAIIDGLQAESSCSLCQGASVSLCTPGVRQHAHMQC